MRVLLNIRGSGGSLCGRVCPLHGVNSENVPLADLETFTPDGADVFMTTDDVDAPMIASLRALPVASYASLESQPTGLR